jgi:cyclic pyranopterin phosphate synthase
MPFDEYVWIDKQEILTFEEITRLAGLFVRLGADQIRLTGGEPLVRRGLDKLISQLSALAGLKDLSLTTNGSLLAEQARDLAAAGLKRINVSIDTLDPEKFKRITKRGDLAGVLDGGVNDDDIIGLVEFARHHGFSMRFIEYMDVGNSNSWISGKMVSKKEILEKINARYPVKEIGRDQGSAPAIDYEFVDGRGSIGVIASVTEPFCSSCTRVRLTADGKLVTCLFSNQGHDLKALVRGGASDEEIIEFIRQIWSKRADRFSDERLESMNSPEGYQPKAHHKIEMITLGG